MSTKTTAIIVLLVAFGIAGGIDMVPQLQQENEALRERVAQMQHASVNCEDAAHVAAERRVVVSVFGND